MPLGEGVSLRTPALQACKFCHEDVIYTVDEDGVWIGLDTHVRVYKYLGQQQAEKQEEMLYASHEDVCRVLSKNKQTKMFEAPSPQPGAGEGTSADPGEASDKGGSLPQPPVFADSECECGCDFEFHDDGGCCFDCACQGFVLKA